MSKELEQAMENAGFAISDTPPNLEQNDIQETQAEPTPAPMESEGVVEQATAENTQPVDAGENQPVESVQQEVTQETMSSGYDDVDVDSEVLRYVSEKLGREVTDYDSIVQAFQSTPAEIDERVAAINDFVLKTGRSPEDWYKYQQLNPSEMDDMTAVRNQMVIEHGNLTPEEVSLLMSNKYKLDEERHDENDIQMSKLQLKLDAEKARQSISDLRDDYQLPIKEGAGEVQSPITEQWVNTMTNEVKEFDGLVFDLPNGEFTFGVDDNYRKSLISKNTQIENYFDDYIHDSGDWNFEKLNAHRALVDNIDSIVNSVYRQGLSDGQRNVVEKAANVTNQSPQANPSQGGNNVADQLRAALGGRGTTTFNV